jgi:hypothetical protein
MVANKCRNSHSNLNLNEIHSIANPFSNYCTRNYNNTKKNRRLVIQPISYFFPVNLFLTIGGLSEWVTTQDSTKRLISPKTNLSMVCKRIPVLKTCTHSSSASPLFTFKNRSNKSNTYFLFVKTKETLSCRKYCF